MPRSTKLVDATPIEGISMRFGVDAGRNGPIRLVAGGSGVVGAESVGAEVVGAEGVGPGAVVGATVAGALVVVLGGAAADGWGGPS
jgi:hypothetical protein